MKPSTRNILIAIAVVVAVVLLARFVVFKEQFEEWGEGLERISDWEDTYRRENPDATDEQVDAAFKAGIANIAVWKANYKKDHPDATDAEVDAAFQALFPAN